LYNILIEIVIPTNVVRPIKMCLNKIYSKVWCILYSEWFETSRCFITIAFQFCFRICHQEGPRRSKM